MRACMRGECLPVSQGGDDKSLCAAQELILVDEVYISDGDLTLVCVLVEVEPSLLLPLKVCWRLDVHLDLNTNVHPRCYNTMRVILI